MSRTDGATDRWHKAALAPGEQPCPGGDGCRGARTAPATRHGQGKRWAATWDEKVNGQRKQRKMLFTSYEQAATVQRQMRQAAEDRSLPHGVGRRRDAVTVAGFFPAFMELTKTERSAGSNGKVRAQFANQVEPHLGDWDMADLQHEPAVIRTWQETLLSAPSPGGKPYSYGTVYEAFRLLGAMFRAALGENSTGVITNPFNHPQARLRKTDRKRVQRKGGWTAELISKAYLADPPQPVRGSAPAWSRYRTMLLLSGTTGGMRLSESAALSPDDIDWAHQVIMVNYTLARDYGGVMYFRTGKSDASQRTMTASPLVLDALDAHRSRFTPVEVTLPLETDAMYGVPMAEWPALTRTLLFSTGNGTPVSDPAYQSAARFGLCQAGLLPARPIESRSVRDPGTGQYAANGGPQRTHHISQRYERPSDHGIHFHALRYFWPSLMHARDIPDTIIKDEVGHKLWASLYGAGGSPQPGRPAGFDVTHDTYIRPIEGIERARWRQKIREIIAAEFGPHLPGGATVTRIA